MQEDGSIPCLFMVFIVFIVGVSHKLRFVRVGYEAHAFCVITAVCADCGADNRRKQTACHVRTERTAVAIKSPW